MATVKSIEDEVTCNVCFGIHEEPHILVGCLHTYCLKCIKRLETRGEIRCPECRTSTNIEDVKKDFKTQRLVDIHNAEQEPVEFFSDQDQCDMCHSTNPITHHCVVCEIFLCSKCSQRHKSIKSWKSHKISSSTVMKKIASSLTVSLDQLESQVKNIDGKLESISQNITKTEKENDKQIKNVKQFTMDGILAMYRNQKCLEKQITDANQTLVNHLQESKIFFEQQKKKLLSKMVFLEDLINRQDIKKLSETGATLNETVKQDIKYIEEIIQEENVDYKSPVQVHKGKNWGVKDSIEVSIDNIQYTSPQIGPVLETLYSELHTQKLRPTHRVDLDFKSFSLNMINNQLWCTGCNGQFNVYDKNCQLVKQIIHFEIWCVKNIVGTNTGHIIVACGYKGLHALNSNGEYHAMIRSGSFADVSCYEGDIYALEYRKCEIIVLREDGNKWNEVNYFSLKHTDIVDVRDFARCRICVYKSLVYLSSANNSCIYVFDTHGSLLYKVGEHGSNRPGQLNCPFLCSVDNVGNMLVADCHNHRLQVYDSSGQWTVIKLHGGQRKPVGVVVSNEGEMWILSQWPNKVQRYTVAIK